MNINVCQRGESRLAGWTSPVTWAPQVTCDAAEIPACPPPRSQPPLPEYHAFKKKVAALGSFLHFSLLSVAFVGMSNVVECPLFLTFAFVTKLPQISLGYLDILRPVAGLKCSWNHLGFSPILKSLLILGLSSLPSELQSSTPNC